LGFYTRNCKVSTDCINPACGIDCYRSALCEVIISVMLSGDFTYAVYEQGWIVDAVCLGPTDVLNTSLLNATLSSGQYRIEGMKVTGFSKEAITEILIVKSLCRRSS